MKVYHSFFEKATSVAFFVIQMNAKHKIMQAKHIRFTYRHVKCCTKCAVAYNYINSAVSSNCLTPKMTRDDILQAVNKVEGIAGMTTNEKLFAAGLIKE